MWKAGPRRSGLWGGAFVLLRGTKPVGGGVVGPVEAGPRGRSGGRSWVVRLVPPEREAPAGNGRPGEGLEGEERALNDVLKQREPDASATRCRHFGLPGGSASRSFVSTPPPFLALSSGAERREEAAAADPGRPLQPGGGEGGGTKPAAVRGNPAGAEGRGSRRASHARGSGLTGRAASGEPCLGREGEPHGAEESGCGGARSGLGAPRSGPRATHPGVPRLLPTPPRGRGVAKSSSARSLADP